MEYITAPFSNKNDKYWYFEFATKVVRFGIGKALFLVIDFFQSLIDTLVASTLGMEDGS